MLYDENCNGSLETLGLGNEVEDAFVGAACMIRAAVISGDYIADELEQELDGRSGRSKSPKRN